ncbi:MAG: hypothetical protein A2Y33_10880 [Spirochaetes bacterium GWF1_51_8]|nr:MAG: hypothetical protein A2Y33_10880 [Spirochaetes bacterium GWF1_51_8]
MRSMIKVLLFAAVLLPFVSCAGGPDYMAYETVFYTSLGTKADQVGCNIPDLKVAFTDENQFLIPDYIDVPTSVQIYRNKVYIADKYNKCVSVFNLNRDPVTNLNIPNQGEGYSFDVPFQVILNKYGEIFVLASVSNYSEQVEVFEQYYVYKFNIYGKFIYRIGINGINSGPMAYPDRIDVDLFGNLYVYIREEDGDQMAWVVKRFLPSGEMSFEFRTDYLAQTHTDGDKTFMVNYSDVYNLKNDEKLLLFSQQYLIEKKDKPVEIPNEVYNVLNLYSILQNSMEKLIYRSADNMDSLLGVTRDDVVVTYAYDEKNKGVGFRFVELSDKLESAKVFYAPHVMDYCITMSYFIDIRGEIYSVIIKDNEYYVILHWIKKNP